MASVTYSKSRSSCLISSVESLWPPDLMILRDNHLYKDAEATFLFASDIARLKVSLVMIFRSRLRVLEIFKKHMLTGLEDYNKIYVGKNLLHYRQELPSRYPQKVAHQSDCRSSLPARPALYCYQNTLWKQPQTMWHHNTVIFSSVSVVQKSSSARVSAEAPHE